MEPRTELLKSLGLLLRVIKDALGKGSGGRMWGYYGVIISQLSTFLLCFVLLLILNFERGSKARKPKESKEGCECCQSPTLYVGCLVETKALAVAQNPQKVQPYTRLIHGKREF